MPRIKEIKVTAFNEVQDIRDDDTIIITGDIDRDMEKAVEADHPCEDDHCEFPHMLKAGAPLTAACMLMGATEVAHIDAVACSYKFNGKIPEGWPHWTEMPDADVWMKYHDEHGRRCPGCESFLYDDESDTCDNCRGHVARYWVRGHTARMTGAFWFKIVDSSGCQVKIDDIEFWDDRDEALYTAATFTPSEDDE